MHFSPPADIFGERRHHRPGRGGRRPLRLHPDPEAGPFPGLGPEGVQEGTRRGRSEDGPAPNQAHQLGGPSAPPPAVGEPAGPRPRPLRADGDGSPGPLPDRSRAEPMNEGIGPAQLAPAGGRARRRRWLPFWACRPPSSWSPSSSSDISVHVATVGCWSVAAVALFVLAVTADGPLGSSGSAANGSIVSWSWRCRSSSLWPLRPALRPGHRRNHRRRVRAVGLVRAGHPDPDRPAHRAVHVGAPTGPR